MIQKEKDLLLQDLSSRLPYGVILECCGLVGEELRTMTKEGLINDDYDIDEVRPMLFPLSSMTEEQWNNARSAGLTDFTFESFKCGCFTLASYTSDNNLQDLLEFINWLYKNHFDVNGLIPLGLAKDATGLGIY